MLLPANDPQTRLAALDAAWASMRGRTKAPREAFDLLASASEVHPVVVDGAIVGAVIVTGAEVHACVLPAAFGRWMGRQALQVVRDLVARHGRATTSVQKHCYAGVKFVQRLGFREIRREGDVIRYELVGAAHGV